MIELKITGDAFEVKNEIENLFNMTVGTVLPQVTVTTDEPKPAMPEKSDVELVGEVEKQVDQDVATELSARDERGYLWDERIHSTGKTINKDGTWRNKKNLDQILLETVESELAKEAAESGSLKVDIIPDSVNPELVENDPPVEVPELTDKDVQSAMIKFTQAMSPLKDENGMPVIPAAVKALTAKNGISGIMDIKENDKRVEFVDMCEKVIANPENWKEILC